jgi:hypothetical protein
MGGGAAVDRLPIGGCVIDEKKDRVTHGKRAHPSQMSLKYTQPGRKWIPKHGPYMRKLGAEHCATSDFEWIGLAFPGEHGYHVFNLDDLQPSD